MLRLLIRYNVTAFPVDYKGENGNNNHATKALCVLHIKAGAVNMAGAWFIAGGHAKERGQR